MVDSIVGGTGWASLAEKDLQLLFYYFPSFASLSPEEQKRIADEWVLRFKDVDQPEPHRVCCFETRDEAHPARLYRSKGGFPVFIEYAPDNEEKPKALAGQLGLSDEFIFDMGANKNMANEQACLVKYGVYLSAFVDKRQKEEAEARAKFVGPPKPVGIGSPEAENLPPVQVKWRRAKAICRAIKNKAPDLIVGGVAGGATRWGLQLAGTACITMAPGVIGVIGVAMCAGAFASVASRLAVNAYRNRKRDTKVKLSWKTLALSAAIGAVGGGAVAGTMQWVAGNVSLPEFVTQRLPFLSSFDEAKAAAGAALAGGKTAVAETAKGVASSSGFSVPETGLTHHGASAAFGAEPIDPAKTLAAAHASTKAAAKAVTGTAAEVATGTAAEAAVAGVAAMDLHALMDVKGLFAGDQFLKLPKHIRRLALSGKPEDMLSFCKEASFKILNGPGGKAKAAKALAASLIKRGIDVADASGIQDTLTLQKLHADYTYLNRWGIGLPKNIALAIEHARKGGTVMHDYCGKFLRSVGALTKPPSPPTYTI